MGSGSGDARARSGGGIAIVFGLLLAADAAAGGAAAAARDAGETCRRIERAELATIAEGVGAALDCHTRAAAGRDAVDEGCLLEAKAAFVRSFPDAPHAPGCESIRAAVAEGRITAFADRLLGAFRPSIGGSRCAARKLKAIRSFTVERLAAGRRHAGEPPGLQLARAVARAERRLARRFDRVKRRQGCVGGAELEMANAVANTFLTGLRGVSAGLRGLQGGTVRGWVPAVDSPAEPLEVHVYIDGPAGAGVYAGSVPVRRGTTAGERVRARRAAGGTRAIVAPGAVKEFAFSIPSRFADGARHTLHAYTVPSGGDPAAAPLPGSPIEFRIGEGVAQRAPEEVVFDWTTDHCGLPTDYDVPDLPVRAFRDHTGQVQLMSSHHTFPGWRMTGPDLHGVTRDCAAVMRSHRSGDPARFDGYEWIASPYTPDGRTVYALVHNEFQGYRDPARCLSGDYPKCWYNAITLAVSTDGGRTYAHAPAPTHLVASLPYRYAPDVGPSGVFSPSSIVHDARDGYYYVMTMALTPANARQQIAGTCLLRTATPGDPTSWRAWGGPERGFTARMGSPYAGSTDAVTCAPVSPRAIGTMHESLKFSSYFGQFLLVGLANRRDAETKRDVWGIYYALSDDLITWSDRRLIFEARPPWVAAPGAAALLYPSVLDPEDTSRNFEVVGQRADLYFTRWSPESPRDYDRDLVRVPIEFF